MSNHENNMLRPIAFAAIGAVAVLLFRELTAWVLQNGGVKGMNLLAEVADSKMLFIRMAGLFLGLSAAHAAFGKLGDVGRWKMLLSVVLIAMLMHPLAGGDFGAIDRVTLLIALSAVAVHGLGKPIAKVIGCAVGSLMVILLGAEHPEAFQHNGVAAIAMIALFLGPTIYTATVAMDGELDLKPIRRFVARIAPTHS